MYKLLGGKSSARPRDGSPKFPNQALCTWGEVFMKSSASLVTANSRVRGSGRGQTVARTERRAFINCVRVSGHRQLLQMCGGSVAQGRSN